MTGGPRAVLTVVCVSYFMAQLDVLMLTVAVPEIRERLAASLGEVVWALSAYILALAVVTISAGRAGDVFGRRGVFLVGMAVYTASSLAGGLAQTPGQLIAARAVQGLGAALFTTQAVAVLVDAFPAERRGTAFGIRGGAAGAATVLAPVLGGLLVAVVGWRWIFLVNVPIGIATLVLAWLVLPRSAPAGGQRLDLPGVGLAAAALSCLGVGISQGDRHGWSGWVWGLLVLAGLLSVAFLAQQRRRQERAPLVPFALFADRGFARMSAFSVVVAITVSGLVLLLSIALQSVVGFDALLAGLVLVPASACSMLLNPVAGTLSGRVGPRNLLAVGVAATVAGMLWTATELTEGAPWTAFVLPMCVIGVGNAFLLTPLVTAAMHDVPPALSGAAAGVLGTVTQIGAMVGAAAVGSLVPGTPTAGSVRLAMVLLAAVALLGAAAFLTGKTGPRAGVHIELAGRR